MDMPRQWHPDGDAQSRRREWLPVRRGGLARLRQAPCARARVDAHCPGRVGMRASAAPLARAARKPAAMGGGP
eukprot:9196192-Pyramimonas_sp.AAC.1